MRYYRHVITTFLVLGILACSSSSFPDPGPGPIGGGGNGSNSHSSGDLTDTDFNILFVGNSLTYTNDLPKLVKDEAAELGINIGTTTLAKPNFAIVDHWSEGEVQVLIESQLYDYVIIQQGPSSQAEGREMLIDGGKDYSELCKANGAELCYYMVWPSLYYYHTFDGVIANYTEAAELNDAILLPVGKTWKQHFDATDDFDYYGPDGFHPSPLGSQVAAEVIVDVLF